jgi:hypothetical protein
MKIDLRAEHRKNAEGSITVKAESQSIKTICRESQWAKQPSPIVSTDGGIAIYIKVAIDEKASLPIWLKMELSSNKTLMTETQLVNAASDRPATDLGMNTLRREDALYKTR